MAKTPRAASNAQTPLKPGRYSCTVNYLVVEDDGSWRLELQLRPSGRAVYLQVEEEVTPQVQATVACRILATKALHTKFPTGAVVEYIQTQEAEFGENGWTKYFQGDMGLDILWLFQDARDWMKDYPCEPLPV